MRTPQIPVAIDGLDFPIWRMRAAAGSDVLLSLDDEAVTVALEWPEGVAGAAEKHLAQGETQKSSSFVRAAHGNVNAPMGGSQSASFSFRRRLRSRQKLPR